MIVRAEFDALTAVLSNAGPDAPTLCDGWRTRHLAAHLHLRDHQPWRILGHANVATTTLAEQHAEPAAYDELLSELGKQPRRLFSLSGLSRIWTGADEAVNLVEYAVHHEDVRRAGLEPVRPRTLDRHVQGAIWTQVGLFARWAYCKAPVGVVLVTPGGPRRRVRRGSNSVALIGEPLEQALYAFGRRAHADIEVQGSHDAVTRFGHWS